MFCFSLIKTHFVFAYKRFSIISEVSLCFSYFFFMWGEFGIYWYILEAGGFCPFMPIFIVGGSKCPGGLMSYTRIPGGGWTGGVLSSFSHPFSPFSHTPLLPSPTPCFLSPSLALLLSPSNLLLSHTPLLLSPIHSLLSPTSSLLSPTPLLPCSLNPVRPYIPVKKSVCANRPRRNFGFFFVFVFFCEQSRIPLKGDPTLDKTLVISTLLFLLIIKCTFRKYSYL